MNVKTCSICKKEKPLSEFGKNKRNLDGLQYACRPCYNARWRKWSREHKEERKKYPTSIKDIRDVILEKLGNKCVRCGFDDWRALQIDHVHGGGVQERRKFKNYYRYLKYVNSLPLKVLLEKYQCLCANCNQIKKYDKKEFPNPVFDELRGN